jgi:hypothetical protein
MAIGQGQSWSLQSNQVIRGLQRPLPQAETAEEKRAAKSATGIKETTGYAKDALNNIAQYVSREDAI